MTPNNLSDSSQPRAAGDLLELEIAGIQVNFRWAPAGTFMMGSPESEKYHSRDETQHEVTLTQGFWIAETLTTQELWQAVMGKNPSWFKGETLPVEQVNWHDCQAFVEKINNSYRNVLPSGYKYAMPTEAQWEYACRAGTSTEYNYGYGWSGGIANYKCDGLYDAPDCNQYETTPVRRYEPNAWGLYDMHGNVAEWTSDWYDCDYYSYSVPLDPLGPVRGFERVLRGGSWDKICNYCRSAARGYDVPDYRNNDYGFRLVLVLDIQSSYCQVDDVTTAEQHPNGEEPESTRDPGAITTLDINGVNVNFHWAPSGTFLMGSPETGYLRWPWEKQHSVTLTKGFWIAETATTQEFWQAVMGDNPSYFQGSNQLPVENVSWNDCQNFVDKLNTVYSCVLPDGYKFAMPTEAQWEYACRAGATTPFNFGSSLNGFKANCDGYCPYGSHAKVAYLEKTTPVKSYDPNSWGLYDMHGNVWEWTSDWFGVDYYINAAASHDPSGPSSGYVRVVRGGSWRSHADECRSAFRFHNEPSFKDNNYGFRLILVQET